SLGSDAEASEETYDLIEDAIENGDDYLDRPDGRYTWAINETKCDECGEVMRSTGPACQPCPDCHRKRNMSDMTSFLIYRIGANAANQSCRDRMAVAIVDAPTEALALEHAALNIEHFAGQHFEAVPEKEADSDDWNAVVEDDEIQELNVGYRRYKIEGWSETLDIRGDFAEASD